MLFLNKRPFFVGRILMFSLNEKVVYPGHGVAQITSIVEKNVGGTIFKFFELRFVNKDMTILVPTSNLSTVGLRRLSSTENIDDVFKLLSEPVQRPYQEITASNWNKRNKEYQCKIRTGIRIFPKEPWSQTGVKPKAISETCSVALLGIPSCYSRTVCRLGRCILSSGKPPLRSRYAASL